MSFDQDVRIDGTSIMSRKFWISDRSGLDMTPGTRSSNFEVAHLQGTMWKAKQIAQVTRSIAMTIDSCDENGVYPATAVGRKGQLNANRIELLSLFTRENAQVEIQRDVILPSGVETWIGYAQAVSSIIPQYAEDFDDYQTLGLDLEFADPVWYGDEIVEVISGSGTINNPGNIAATNLTIAFAGGSNYRLTNADTSPDETWVQVDNSGNIVLDVRNATAIKNGTNNVIADLSRFGSRQWMRIEPGDNSMTLTGGGTATVTFRVPRL